MNKPPIPQLRAALGNYPYYDRTRINSWENIQLRKAVEATGRTKSSMTGLRAEGGPTFPALDALAKGYEVDVVVSAVGSASVAAHEAALHRIEQPLTCAA